MDNMDLLTDLLALLRFVVVFLVLVFNISSIRKSRKLHCNCVNGLLADSTKICSVIYILTWVPYLLNSLINGTLTVSNCTTFCLMQNYMTNAISMVLLAFACIVAVKALKREISKKVEINPRIATVVVLCAWFFPQAVYFFTVTRYDGRVSRDFQFVEKYFNASASPALEGISLKVGFTICGIRYSPLARSQYYLNYLLLVLPLGGAAVSAVVLRLIIKLVKKLRKTVDDQDDLLEPCAPPSCPTGCHRFNPCLGPVLGVHVLWHFLLKPIVLSYWWYYLNHQNDIYIDIGSHMALAAVAIFTPVGKRKEKTPETEVYSVDVKM